MNEHTTTAPVTLTMRRIFRASRTRVFDAWIDADLLRRWLAPGAMSVAQAAVDPRVGGKYQITMLDTDGERVVVGGTYREIDRPSLLSMTWEWVSDETQRHNETLVTIEFIERGDETEMLLTHTRFADTTMRDRHEHGWTGCFVKLIALLESEETTA